MLILKANISNYQPCLRIGYWSRLTKGSLVS
nr:MAG TPA: hypothetical protein [Caudoviricetes sp.]DAS71736.1 MAG TPA: hypothetical protein [Caudoviricetes sp.]